MKNQSLKKGLVWPLSLALAFSMTACSGKEASETTSPATTAPQETQETKETQDTQATEAPTEAQQAAALYTPGTYTATVRGHNAEMTVAVTFEADAIESVEVTEHGETYGLGYGLPTSPVETIGPAIVQSQSLAVDSVTSATITSMAIKQAVADCVEQAGADPDELRKAPAASSSSGDETYEADIVVIGAGAAGLSTAVAAYEAGANVIVLEKTGITGGATTRSGGKILAAGTAWQEKQGYEDTPDLMYSYLMSFDHDNLIDTDLLRLFCDSSLENMQWLTDRGVQIQDVEAIHSSLTPWRVHNVNGGGGMTVGHGGQICVPLTQELADGGVPILYNCRAKELITDDSGAVTGVIAEKSDGGTVTVSAPAIVLATGGYEHNKEMMARYSEFLPDNSASGVPVTNVGDGLILAEAVGAEVFNSDGMQISYVDRSAGVGLKEESGLIVNAKGERVANEYSYKEHVATAVAESGSPVCYYIADASDPNPTVQYAITLESTPQAATPEELAALIDMDPSVLSGTLARYNELCANGEDTDFGKPAEYMNPIEGPAYFAIQMVPGCSVNFGGLHIDADAHVLNTDGELIPGLYAAGEVAFTGLFATEYPCCGMAIGSAVFFGRTAAASAIEEMAQ